MIAMPSRVRWGWSTRAHVLLALAAIGGGAWLFVLDPAERGPTPAAPTLVADPNTAPRQVLGALPKIGPALADRIVEARSERPFQSLDDLDRRVSRIGPATMDVLRPHLAIDSPPAPSVKTRQPRRSDRY